MLLLWRYVTTSKMSAGSHITHAQVTLVDMQALPIFLDRLVDPVTAVVLSVTVVLFLGKLSNQFYPFASSL